MTTQTYPPADLGLARRLEHTEGQTSASFAQTKARLDPASGAAYCEVGGAHAMFDGPDSPLTQTFGLGMADAVSNDDLAVLEEFFVSRMAPVDHEVSPLAGCELLATLAHRGYQPLECTSVMYRPVGTGMALRGDLSSAIRAHLAYTNDYAVWASTAAEGWQDFGDYSALMHDVVKVFGQCECWKPFIAEANGRPIAAAALSMIDGIALLAGASTIPTARKQGAQQALLNARLHYAAQEGCDLAMMCANPGSGSQRNAERHHFRIAYTRTKWRRSLPA
jgi:hypothetical protein